MNIVLLGTGCADGWPTPFCTCSSCSTLRARGEVRGQTSALIDNCILLDCGPETGRSAVRAGITLNRVHTVLLTHAHPDHCDGQALLWRAWDSVPHRLLVAGPADAIERLRPWVGPDDPIDWLVVTPGDTFNAQGYSIRTYAASHSDGAVLYGVKASDETHALYATDTGPLSEATVDAMRDSRFDVVLLEETWGDQGDHDTRHLDLATFADTVRRLRDVNAVTETTDVVAIHLGHRNPPEPELSRRLGAWGARAGHDHEELIVGTDTPRPRPARRTLVTGGARSGKSHEAERLVAGDSRVVYIATAPVGVGDREWTNRIQEHQSRRPSHWRTEETTDVAAVLGDASPEDTVVVDCLTLWLTAALDRTGAWNRPEDLASLVAPVIDELVDAVRMTSARVVLVTNEVGSGIVPDTSSGREFRDLLGRLNQRIAAECEDVLLVVAGRTLSLTLQPSLGAPR